MAITQEYQQRRLNHLSRLIFIVVLFLLGCSSGKNSIKPAMPFASKAIHLSYRGDSQLNLYNDKPHALLVVIYQLDTVNGFAGLSKTEDGLLALLSGKPFDSSVMQVQPLFIEPGTKGNLDLDRVEKTAWVGIAAGYNSLMPNSATKFYMIPVKGSKQLPLSIDLIFSSNSIQDNPVIHEK